jgi:hypothetical protein
MEVSRDDFADYLSQATFEKNGDLFEREHSSRILELFPRCEDFWKFFVIPLTDRISGYSNDLTHTIDFRITTSDQVQDIANYHYSMFLNLVYANLHIQGDELSKLEDTYVHLATACDLAESVLIKWFLLVSECRGKPIESLQKHSKEEFLGYAGKWYEKNYDRLYDIYKDQMRQPPIRLPESGDILVEFFGEDSELRKAYIQASRPIRELRNIIVHDLKIARIVECDNEYLVPKSSMIQSYRSWRDVAAVAMDEVRIKKDFTTISEQCNHDFEVLASNLNEVWFYLINDFQEEFFSNDRDDLRRHFDIQFSNGPHVVLDRHNGSIEYPHFPSASGTYSGGTADYNLGNGS